MSAVTMCDGPRCHRGKGETDAWIELVEDSMLYDFHHPDCLNEWLNGAPDEEIPADMRETVEIVLRGEIIGTNRERGHLYFRGHEVESAHVPWTYTLHWSTTTRPVS